MKQNLILSLVCVLLATGCVSSGKYKDLESAHQSTAQQLAECENNREALEKKLGVTSTEKRQLEGSVVEMKKALAEAEVRKIETEKRLKEFRELTEKFKSLVDAGKLAIKFHNGRMLIALSSDILFSSGSANLSEAGKTSIREVAILLKDLSGRKFQIEGHTDNLPIKTKMFPSNWELASARAMSVLNTMIAAEFPQNRISTASYANTDPVAANETPEGRAENRRIAIAIVPDLSTLPGTAELNQIK
jgi:chemotaxis protein MotB